MALGYDPDDILTDVLPLAKMLAIIVPSPPGTAVRWSLDEGWTKEAHLLANMAEQGAGLIDLQRRHPRPGVGAAAAPLLQANRAVDVEAMRQQRGVVSERMTGFDSMTMDEWEKVKAENWARPAGKMKRAV